MSDLDKKSESEFQSSKKSGRRIILRGCLSTTIAVFVPGVFLTHEPTIPDNAIMFVSDWGNLAGRGIFVMNSDGSDITLLSDIPSKSFLFDKLWNEFPQWFPIRLPRAIYHHDPIWSPDGSKIAFLTIPKNESNYEVYLMDVTSRKITRVTHSNVNKTSVIWAPNGKYIAFTSLGVDYDPVLGILNDIVILNTSDYSTTTIISRSPVDYPSWSPDNTKILYLYQADNIKYSLYSIVVDSRKTTPLTDVSVVGLPDWSPNGASILFLCETHHLNFEICKTNEDGSDFKRLTNTPGNSLMYEVVWSPDGSKIAFIESVDISAVYNHSDLSVMIFVMNSDGSGLVQLTQPAIYYSGLAWSPDSKKIAFVGDPNGSLDIYVINTDGTELRRLTDFPASQPSWRP